MRYSATAFLLLHRLIGIGMGSIASAQENPMVHRAGTELVDGSGQRVDLRGVNLGGWLLWEGWIMGDGGFTAESTIASRLETLLGTDAAREFRRGFYDAFITPQDLARIAQAKFNTIRVPINCKLLTGADSEDGWKRIDRLLDWAEEQKLYVVLDLHAAPGGQSILFTADPDGINRLLWSRRDCRDQTIALWRSIAQRYRNRKIVAAYDLLNEPWSSDWDMLLELYRTIIAAIREVDPNHLVMIEGNKLGTDFSKFTAPPTDNMAYSFHIYTWFGDDRENRMKAYCKLAPSSSDRYGLVNSEKIVTKCWQARWKCFVKTETY